MKKNKTGTLCCPTPLFVVSNLIVRVLTPESPLSGVQKHQGGTGVRLKLKKQKRKKGSQITKSQKETFHFIVEKRKTRAPLTVDFPTTMVSVSKIQFGESKTVEPGLRWQVGGEGRPATGPKKRCLCATKQALRLNKAGNKRTSGRCPPDDC